MLTLFISTAADLQLLPIADRRRRSPIVPFVQKLTVLLRHLPNQLYRHLLTNQLVVHPIDLQVHIHLLEERRIHRIRTRLKFFNLRILTLNACPLFN